MRWTSYLAAIAAAGALASSMIAPASGDTTQGESPRSVPVSVDQVTLITGDKVVLRRFADGRQAATVDAAPGREHIAFRSMQTDGKLRVIPSDVGGHLAAGLIDEALFNITDLVAEGFADGRGSTLPLIMTFRSNAAAGEVTAFAGARTTRALPSVNGAAVKAEKANLKDFWKSVHGTVPTSGTARPALAAGVGKIWLDGKVKGTLDKSVAQIGAPDAWKAGYSGKGVTVAVLDTGADLAHPDIKSRVKEAKSFVDGETPSDGHGHGTHVASTIAGAGQAGAVPRKGVAPDARLLVGKVLSDGGWGSDSGVIAGMEWAARSGAKVVNMSLGGGRSDGKDPMSLAVDALTAETGALFVIAAGNDGAEESVGSPGTADAALTVGAVDRDDRLAPFSSYGPRFGDLAVKPDITAPGVGIIAARALGTTMGTPLSGYHTAASGTSMATPHVAGAAAVLSQQHPDWTARQLKDALVSTARTSSAYSAYQQGGGRVDLARATRQQLFATGTLNFGEVAAETTKPLPRKVRYTNTSNRRVTLSFEASLDNTNGRAPRRGAVTAPGRHTLQAGESADIPITIHPEKLSRGRHSGYLVATGDRGEKVHTSLGIVKNGARHTIEVEYIGPDGGQADVQTVGLWGEDPRSIVFAPRAMSSFEVQEGTYYLEAMTIEDNDDTYLLVQPEIRVTGDTKVVLDARKAKRATISTPQRAVQHEGFSWVTHRALGRRSLEMAHINEVKAPQRFFVTPTAPVKEGTFELDTRWQLTAPLVEIEPEGAGKPLDYLSYVSDSPAIEQSRRLEAVLVAGGAPDDFAKVDVKGKLAVITDERFDGENSRKASVRAAADAGAVALLLVTAPDLDRLAVGRFLPESVTLEIPTLITTSEEGRKVTDAMARGEKSVELSGTTRSPYLYDVIAPFRGRVPDRIHHEVTADNTAEITARYRDGGAEFRYINEQRFGWQPWQLTTFNESRRLVPAGFTRREYVSTGDTTWQHLVSAHNDDSFSAHYLVAPYQNQARSYRAGSRSTEDWGAAVVRPAIPKGVNGAGAFRTEDALTFKIPEFVDGSSQHLGFAARSPFGDTFDKVTTELHRDGKLLTRLPSAWGAVSVPAPAANYRLDVTTRRDLPGWRYGTSTKTSWTFTSRRPGAGDSSLLPLLQVDYGVPTDLANTAPAGRPFAFDLTARHQDGLDGPAVAGIKAWVSYDDGGTWTQARTERAGSGKVRATVRHPEATGEAGFVTLRVRAWDSAGNGVDQTVVRAYGLK
ncbi:S8 family serine peptidase [Streptomyces sp. NPDC056222]|uniref:S8 family serine peptidase n=1 Tax=Streptomyces sp. NPDC056222 TaxID=3345749 RepID=UPI0035DB04BA